MKFPNFQSRGSFLCSQSKQTACGFRIPWNRVRDLTLWCMLLAPLFFSIGCGKHKAQVKTPVPPAPSSKSTPSSKQQIPPVAQKRPVPEESKQPSGSKIPKPWAGESAALRAGSSGPLIRIGLITAATDIQISSSGGFYLSDKTAESEQRLVRGEVQVRSGQEVEESADIFRIQVASFSRPESAEDLKQKMEGRFPGPVIVRKNPEVGTHQVRMGSFPSKEEAQELLKAVAASGYADAFVVKETASSGGGKTMLALRGPENLFRQNPKGFLISPVPGAGFLILNGKPYRGDLDIRLNQSGRITVVNQLSMEEYLCGVVPAEISPTQYPEFDALAAQSIAARTYALKNMGRYRSEGYDLSADTRTQVYGGVAMEKDSTNEAVKRTSGLAIYYQGKLIDAMYMSTCGGRTEDYSNVFDAASVPYLKSVFCAIEGSPENNDTALNGKHEIEPLIKSDDGSIANRNLELAHILGVVESASELTPEFLAGKAESCEVDRWVRNAGKIAQKDSSGGQCSMAETGSRAGFLQYAAELFFGADEIRRRISSKDVEYYMNNLRDGYSVPESARFAMAYLIQRGLWLPELDNSAKPDAPMQRSGALFLILRWLESAKPEVLRRGSFVSEVATEARAHSNSTISIRWGNRTLEFPLSEKLALFRLDAGRIMPVDILKIIGNEKLAFHVNSEGFIDFLEVELNPTGASSDRYSPVAAWDVTIPRSVISEKLRTLSGAIGEITDLKPARLGNSGRVVQIQVLGSRGSVVLNGYKVRNALGLRDTLFTITREHSPDGSIANFRFHGRGWGHGIGLCQVGAFGMARAGHGYEEILKTYYQGVQIRNAY